MVLNGTILGSFLERKDMSVRDVRQVCHATLLGAAYHVDAALCAWTIELVVLAFSRASRGGTRNFEGINQAALRSSAMSMELEGALARGMWRPLWVLPGTLKHHLQKRIAAIDLCCDFFQGRCSASTRG